MKKMEKLEQPEDWAFYVLIIPIIFLCLIGALITGSLGGQGNEYLSKNINIICGGVVFAIICNKYPKIHLYLIKHASKLLVLIAFPLIYLVVARLMSTQYWVDTEQWLFRPKVINGSVRWLNIGGVSLQVGEFAKLAICFYLAFSCGKYYDVRKIFWRGLCRIVIPCFVIALLILFNGSKSMTVVCMAIMVVTLLIYGVKMRYLCSIVLLLVLLFTIVIYGDSNKMKRIEDWVHSTMSHNFDYDTQAGISIGVFSYKPEVIDFSKVELFERSLKLPEKHNDFIFSLVGYQLGYFCVFVVMAYFLFFWGCMIVMRQAITISGKVLAFSLGFSIVLVAFTNIFVVTGLLPVTGVTAPFLSAGGSNLVISLLSVGLLVNIRAYTVQFISDERLKESFDLS